MSLYGGLGIGGFILHGDGRPRRLSLYGDHGTPPSRLPTLTVILTTYYISVQGVEHSFGNPMTNGHDPVGPNRGTGVPDAIQW